VLSERELAFIALYKDSYPRIYQFVLRRVDEAELAEELAADVFRVAWQKWDEQAGLEIPWLFSVARNLIGNAYRGRDRQKALQSKLMATAAGPFTNQDGSTPVEDALAALREKDRDILQLAYWDGLGMAEISQVLQCTPASAKVRLHRARAAFRRLMPALAGAFEQKVSA
jgi:RNA polymerase sigma factor (sigma-70 family)